MRIPVVCGVIDRRILVNYRVDESVLAAMLPAPFRPQLVHGFGMAGICLIRLKAMRPHFVPLPIGLGSENAAHRIAVEWDRDGQTYSGVYVPRRDTSSRLNCLVGGRLFPGEQHRATFHTIEENDRYQVSMRSIDGSVALSVDSCIDDRLPRDSIFDSIDEVSRFFEAGSVGYSPNSKSGGFDGLELQSSTWKVTPLAVRHVESTFFQDSDRFPDGSVQFDCALLMRGVEHEWHGQTSLCCEG